MKKLLRYFDMTKKEERTLEEWGYSKDEIEYIREMNLTHLYL